MHLSIEISFLMVAKFTGLTRIADMGEVKSHRDLIVWQKALRLSVMIAELVKGFPMEDRNLAEQMKRSARSVHANIAEGHGRGTRKDYLSFLAVANGSLQETDSHLAEAIECGLISRGRGGEVLGLLDEVSKMLMVLRWRLKDKG
jgi:four helix bundle protein